MKRVGFRTVGASVRVDRADESGVIVRGWLRFVTWPTNPAHVTRSWWVRGSDDELLGEVRWYAPWRRFAFYPADRTVFEPDCLEALAQFCREQTAARAAERKSATMR